MYANDKIFFETDDGILLGDSVPIHEFPSDDEGWVSPPDCSYTSSKDFSITLNDAEENSYDLDETWLGTNSGESNNSRKERVSDEKSKSGSISNEVDASGSVSLVHDNPKIKSVLGSDCHASNMRDGTSDGIQPLVSSNEQYLFSPFKGHENQEDPTCSDPLICGKRGKNAYAMSVLRQVELKIEGRDINDGRVMQASKQVDHLINEATSIDNLCDMYEGWTPWI